MLKHKRIVIKRSLVLWWFFLVFDMPEETNTGNVGQDHNMIIIYGVAGLVGSIVVVAICFAAV